MHKQPLKIIPYSEPPPNRFIVILNLIQNEGIGKSTIEKFGINLVNEDVIKSTDIKVFSFVSKLFNSTLDLLTTIGVMYFLLYFFIREGTAIRRGLLSILPFLFS